MRSHHFQACTSAAHTSIAAAPATAAPCWAVVIKAVVIKNSCLLGADKVSPLPQSCSTSSATPQ
jgi:hypothetical protein